MSSTSAWLANLSGHACVCGVLIGHVGAIRCWVFWKFSTENVFFWGGIQIASNPPVSEETRKCGILTQVCIVLAWHLMRQFLLRHLSFFVSVSSVLVKKKFSNTFEIFLRSRKKKETRCGKLSLMNRKSIYNAARVKFSAQNSKTRTWECASPTNKLFFGWPSSYTPSDIGTPGVSPDYSSWRDAS